MLSRRSFPKSSLFRLCVMRGTPTYAHTCVHVHAWLQFETLRNTEEPAPISNAFVFYDFTAFKTRGLIYETVCVYKGEVDSEHIQNI